MRTLKMICSLGLILGLIGNLSAQELNPVKWEFKIVEEATGAVAIYMTAHMDEGWHVYATYLPSDEGPIATTIEIESADGYELFGDLEYPNPIREYDSNFKMDVNYYEKEVTFKQYVRITGSGSMEVRGALEFMCCNTEMCLPPTTVPIKVELN